MKHIAVRQEGAQGREKMEDITVVEGEGADGGSPGDAMVVGEGEGNGKGSGSSSQAARGDRVKGPWSPEEDAILSRLVSKFGARNWSLIARGIAGRSGKSCRLRWCNQLDPSVKRKPFTGNLHVDLNWFFISRIFLKASFFFLDFGSRFISLNLFRFDCVMFRYVLGCISCSLL